MIAPLLSTTPPTRLLRNVPPAVPISSATSLPLPPMSNPSSVIPDPPTINCRIVVLGSPMNVTPEAPTGVLLPVAGSRPPAKACTG